MPGFADLSPGYAAVARVVAPLVVLLLLALASRGVARLLFLAQIVYWGLSFVGRPLLLLAVQPKPSFGDNIADPRLSDIGYDYGIAHVLVPIQLGLWIYVALVAVFVAWQRLRGPAPEPLPAQSRNTMLTFAAMWLIGALARVALRLTGGVSKAGEVHSANPYLDILATLGSLGAIGAILYFRGETLRTEAVVIGFLGAGELVWGLAEESKTPFMGAVLALAIRYLSTGVSRVKLVGIVGGGAVVASLFGWMQSRKSSERASSMVNQAGLTFNLSYPESVRPYLSIFRRFDLLEAATDTYYFGSKRPWLGPFDIASNALLNLVPAQLGVAKVQSGPSWAKNVRGVSVDMSTISVSLAEGHLNEGTLAGGAVGVCLESLFVIGMIALVARCLRARSVPLITVGVAYVAFPSLFERGALGVTETLGKTVQQAAIAGMIAAAFWLNRQMRAKARGAPLARAPLGQTRSDGVALAGRI